MTSTISRLASNIKSLLSASKRAEERADEMARDAGLRSPRVESLQHGSGSRTGPSSSSPERGRNGQNENNPYDEQELVNLTDEEFNARIEESRAALLTLRRDNIRRAPAADGWESNPNFRQEERPGTGIGRAIPKERNGSVQDLGPVFEAANEQFDDKGFEQKYDRAKAYPVPTSPVDVKSLVKIETLLKECKVKLTSPANFSSWLLEVRKIGMFRRWPPGLFDVHTPGQLRYIDYRVDERSREEAYLTLTSTITSDVAYLISTVTFGHVEEAMCILRDKYTAVTTLQITVASREFGQMSMENTGLDVDAFIAAIKIEAGKVREMGETLSEIKMSATLVYGLLSPDFDPIKCQLSDDRDLGNFDYIASKISNFAKFRGISSKKVKLVKKVDGYALATTERKQPECRNFKETGKCSYGEKCRYKHVKPKDESKDGKECYKCGEHGHWAKDCKSNSTTDKSPKKAIAAPIVKKESEEQGPGHHVACPMLMSAATKSDAARFFGIDSFASSHLTNDRDDFAIGSIRKVEINFTIGNGEDIVIREEGDIFISQGMTGKVIKLMDVGYYPDLPHKLISGGRLFKAGFKIDHSDASDKMDICLDGEKFMEAVVRNNVLVVDNINIKNSKKGNSCLSLKENSKGSKGAMNHDTLFCDSPVKEKESPDPKNGQDDVPQTNFLELQVQHIQPLNVDDNQGALLELDADESSKDEQQLIEAEKPIIERAVQGVSELTMEEVHVRFGHVNIKTICKILGLPPPTKDTPRIECESCELEKQRKQSLPDKAQSRASRPMYRLHIDSSGKKSPTEGGNNYFVVVVDDNSRKGWLLLTASKSDIPNKIATLVKQLQAQHPARKLAFIRLDGAKEYSQQAFKDTITKMGCSFEVSAPYRQAQNGVAEARVGLIWKMAMSFISFSAPDHPRSDWGYAVKHANMIVNMIPSDANGGLSPDEVWGDARSKLEIPGPLFCLCFAKVYVRGKMEPEAIKCIYMGNSEDHKAFLVRPIEGDHTGVMTSRDVTFFPSQMPYRHPTVRRPICVNADEPLEESDVEPEDEVNAVEVPEVPAMQETTPQGEQVVKSDVPRGYTPGSTVFVVDQHERTKQWRVYQVTVDSYRTDGVWIKFRGRSEAFGSYTPEVDVFRSRAAAEKLLSTQEKANPILEKGSIFSLMNEDDKRKISSLLETDPETRAEMLKHPHKEGYMAAEVLELSQLLEMKVYELVEREEGMNVLDSKWVYKAKRHLSSGEIDKYRSRLVAKGFKERYGMEYWETFSSNIKLEDARLMLAIAAYYDFDLWHFDIKAYFLYGVMDEEVYMRQPEGYHEGPSRGQPGEKVCRLLKAIYGTKQAQRCADKILKQAFIDVGVKPIMSDNSMYYAREGDKIFMCGMYVDDGICFSNDDAFLQEKLDGIRKVFEIIVIKHPKVFVGIQIERDRAKGTMLLHQEGAVMKLIGVTGLMDCKPALTPMQTGIILSNPTDMPDMSPEVKSFPYQSLVGQMLWLLGTRIDLSFSINVLSRYMSKWDEQAITMLKRAVRYLRGKERYGIVYARGPKNAKLEDADKEPNKMLFYGDADHASREHDSKSTGGFTKGLAGNTTSFCTKTHTTGISTSSGQSEAVTCKLVCQDAEWTSGMLKEIQIRGQGPMLLLQDNQSVISLSANPVNHKRSKHYRIAMAYVRDLVERLVIALDFCPTEVMAADVLTKPLSEAQHWKLLKILRFGKLEWFNA